MVQAGSLFHLERKTSMVLFKKSSVSKDLINLVRARDNGEEWAMKKLAELCGNELVTIPELCEARIIIYQAAAKRGNKDARYWMGFSLQIIDPQASFKWLLDLAREGDTRAMKAIANGFSILAYYGEDPEKELYWHLEAAKLGDAEAQFEAGRDYHLKQEYEKAWEWYEKAANQGFVRAVLGLAELAIKHGDDRKNEVRKKYNYDFQNPAMQEELKAAMKQSQNNYAGAAELLDDIIDGKYEDCTRDEAAKAFDMLGDMLRRNAFEDAPPSHEEAVRYYFLASLFDDDESLISRKKMDDIIAQKRLHIPRTV